MAALAGETIVAGKVPGERIQTAIRVADSAIVTSEAVIDTVIAAVVIGRTYKVVWNGRPKSTVASDDYLARIREDGVAGTILQEVAGDLPIVGRESRVYLEGEYTADATEDKTFVVTLQRLSGTGDVHGDATSTAPTYLYADYNRG